MKILKYGSVGAVAAAVDFCFFAIFAKYMGMNYFLVGALGFTLATSLNYCLSIRFVFEKGIRFGPSTEFLLVFLISLVGLMVNQMVLYFGISWLEQEMLMVKILATGSVFFWNYMARSRFVFVAPPDISSR